MEEIKRRAQSNGKWPQVTCPACIRWIYSKTSELLGSWGVGWVEETQGPEMAFLGAGHLYFFLFLVNVQIQECAKYQALRVLKF